MATNNNPLPTNLSSLGAVTNTATALSNLVVAVPQIINSIKNFNSSQGAYQPQLAISADNPTINTRAQPPPALLFNYEGEQTATFESDITDHYIENNSAIQDNISLKPIIITTHGFIGEVNNVVPSQLLPLNQLATTLTLIDNYVPTLSVAAQIAYNEAFQLYQTAQDAINASVSAWSSINNNNQNEVINGVETEAQLALLESGTIPNQSKQQIAFQQFYGYYADRTLFTIQTPWAIFQNCAIMKIRAIQSEETRMVTDFEVVFKQLRFTNSLETTFQATAQLAGRRDSQASTLVQTGFGNNTSQVSTTISQGIQSITV